MKHSAIVLLASALIFAVAPREVVGAQTVDNLSLLTTRIILNNAGRPVSLGTGFFFRHTYGEDQHVRFLVTNVHVLTGHPPGSNEEPAGDAITFFCHEDIARPEAVRELSYPLYTASREPVFLTSRSTTEADVALIPLPTGLVEDCQLVVATESDTQGNMLLRPSSTTTLIGYPYGFFDEVNFLPVWKTGAIASEPEIDFGGSPVFLVDVSAFPGMSGSPVFALSSGPYRARDGNTIVGAEARILLGIFSSMRVRRATQLVEELQSQQRLGVQLTESLELGFVWRAEVIAEIAASFDVAAYEARMQSQRNP